jgi:hypothetical protein
VVFADEPTRAPDTLAGEEALGHLIPLAAGQGTAEAPVTRRPADRTGRSRTGPVVAAGVDVGVKV